YLGPPYDWGDRLEDVLDYDRLRQGILDILAGGHIKLLETLGERVVEMCFAFAQVDGGHLQIVKLEAHADCEVGDETRRPRQLAGRRRGREPCVRSWRLYRNRDSVPGLAPVTCRWNDLGFPTPRSVRSRRDTS